MRFFTIVAAGTLFAAAGVAAAQDNQMGDHHALGSSMGTQADATPRSHEGQMASGAHHTPVAKAGRKHGYKSAGSHKQPTATGSGDMTPSGNATAGQQH